MKKLIAQILTPLIDDPKSVKLTQITGKKTVLIELRCNKADLGKVIGKNGKTIGSIRTLLNAIASRDNNRRVALEVVE